MSPPVPRRAIIGLGLGFAILAANALIAYQAVASLKQATRSVEDGLQVVGLLRSVSAAVADSEAGQRSYIISEKKEYLESSAGSLRVADRRLDDIRALIGDDLAELERVGSLKSSIAARTAEFEHTLALLTNGDRPGALTAVSTQASRQNLEAAYQLVGQLTAKQDALFTHRTRQVQEDSRFALATQYMATFFGLVFLGLIYYLVYREITVRRQSEEKLRIVATHDPQRIMDAMAQPFVVEGQEVHLTASIGISVFPDDGRTLLRNADIALYRAKEKGRNTCQFYSAQIDNHSRERLALESGLRRALERDELRLHYQPKVDIATGQVCGMEALLRWQHPEMGLVAPDRFIPIAEESGLIGPIGAWVLKTACRQSRAWRRQGMKRFPIAVNLSPRQFAEQSLLDDIKSALTESGLDAPDLELEITESMVMDDPEQAVDILRRLKNLGIRMAIDDFGTGYSSLAYLKRFPIDSVKVDRSFVEDIPEDVDSMAIAQAVIAMAHSLRLKVVAEGVESEAQLGFLRGEGCDEIQGHYFSAARAASEIPGIMHRTLRRGTAVYLAERRRRAAA